MRIRVRRKSEFWLSNFWGGINHIFDWPLGVGDFGWVIFAKLGRCSQCDRQQPCPYDGRPFATYFSRWNDITHSHMSSSCSLTNQSMQHLFREKSALNRFDQPLHHHAWPVIDHQVMLAPFPCSLMYRAAAMEWTVHIWFASTTTNKRQQAFTLLWNSLCKHERISRYSMWSVITTKPASSLTTGTIKSSHAQLDSVCSSLVSSANRSHRLMKRQRCTCSSKVRWLRTLKRWASSCCHVCHPYAHN